MRLFIVTFLFISCENSNNNPLIIFPQGTRCKTIDRPNFKKGVERIYKLRNIKCQPVVMNSGDIWPKGSKFMKSGKAIINTLDPIDITKYTKDTIDELVFETQEKMAKVYKELTDSIK